MTCAAKRWRNVRFLSTSSIETSFPRPGGRMSGLARRGETLYHGTSNRTPVPIRQSRPCPHHRGMPRRFRKLKCRDLVSSDCRLAARRSDCCSRRMIWKFQRSTPSNFTRALRWTSRWATLERGAERGKMRPVFAGRTWSHRPLPPGNTRSARITRRERSQHGEARRRPRRFRAHHFSSEIVQTSSQFSRLSPAAIIAELASPTASPIRSS